MLSIEPGKRLPRKAALCGWPGLPMDFVITQDVDGTPRAYTRRSRGARSNDRLARAIPESLTALLTLQLSVQLLAKFILAVQRLQKVFGHAILLFHEDVKTFVERARYGPTRVL
jgi:hypothetical protein